MQKALGALCKKRGLTARKMVKRVATRWNTMHNVINRAILLKKPLNTLCSAPEWNDSRRPTLRMKRFFLVESEWHILESLLPTFKVCSLLCSVFIVS